MSESKFQAQAIKWLREQGAYVLKCRPGYGVPSGCPDAFAFYGARHADIEFKASATAPYQPGQEATLGYLKRNGGGNQFVYTAYPENWELIQRELLRDFF